MGFSDVQQVPGVVNCGSCMARYPLVSLEASKKKIWKELSHVDVEQKQVSCGMKSQRNTMNVE